MLVLAVNLTEIRFDSPPFVAYIGVTMKTAAVRDLRHDFAKVLTWIEDGQEVRITKRRRIVARLVPEQSPSRGRFKLPDFARRLKAIHGDAVLSAADVAAILNENKGAF